MNRHEWLKSKHQQLEDQVAELEAERNLNRDPDHKALLVSVKRRRLAVKTELASELASVNL